MGWVVMSGRDIRRIAVLSEVRAGKRSAASAAAVLPISGRQVRRLLDRLGRSLPHLLNIVTGLCERGVAFRSLTEQMDTTTPHGELLFSIFGALAQYERALTQERVRAGLAAARRRGRRGGWPPEIGAEKLDAIIAALNGGATKAAICRTFGAERTTLIETLARAGWSGPSTATASKGAWCRSHS